ncbi:ARGININOSUCCINATE LYASE [Salix koriyanagi]|uniref:ARGININOSUCCINATE LYASE n=1 Tax=Salix koriyanagi TaxID=2511006 RepID=A0A9Q0TDE8_9ROSI|nr:ARGININOSUCCINATE LYASE [Salix koriyanagi]
MQFQTEILSWSFFLLTPSQQFIFLDWVKNGCCGPQRNLPDPMELVRGKSARVIGDLVTLLTLCKGLPLAYNRDLQEDKEPVFDSVKTVVGMLEVSAEFAQNITFNRERIQKSLPAGHLDATTLADYLVNKGLPFRTAHEVVGTCVHLCVSRNLRLEDLTLDDLKHISPAFNQDVYEYLGVENAVNKFSSYGSTGSACVASQLDYWVTKLEISKNLILITNDAADN